MIKSNYSRSLSTIHLTFYSFRGVLVIQFKIIFPAILMIDQSGSPGQTKPGFKTLSHSAFHTCVCIRMNKYAYIYIIFDLTIKILMLVIKNAAGPCVSRGGYPLCSIQYLLISTKCFTYNQFSLSSRLSYSVRTFIIISVLQIRKLSHRESE